MDKIKIQSKEAEALTAEHRTIEALKRLYSQPSQPFEYGLVNYRGYYPTTWKPDTITITIYKDEPITRPLSTDEMNTVTTWELERSNKIKELKNG